MVKKKLTQSIRNRIIRHLREWHRRLGIFAAFFLIFLSVSGIALNHTTLFSLSHQSITNPWLLKHYGIKPPSDIRFYQQKKWLVTDQLAWLGDKLVFESDDDIISITQFQDYHLIATRTQLVILTEAGALVDKLNTSSDLPVPISALSTTSDHIILKTIDGYFQSDRDFIDWKKIQTITQPKWVAEVPATTKDMRLAKIKYQSQFLTLERIILDAHSGRLFGNIGVWFMDAVAIMLILLSVSGIYIWLRYARSKR